MSACRAVQRHVVADGAVRVDTVGAANTSAMSRQYDITAAGINAAIDRACYIAAGRDGGSCPCNAILGENAECVTRDSMRAGSDGQVGCGVSGIGVNAIRVIAGNGTQCAYC